MAKVTKVMDARGMVGKIGLDDDEIMFVFKFVVF